MRNPKRIPKVLDAIKKEWEKEPDWRFGQFFFNTVINEIGDPFFIEDDDLILLIQGKLKTYVHKKRK
jgi:uncharacterized protein YihD (DUF1040 family)